MVNESELKEMLDIVRDLADAVDLLADAMMEEGNLAFKYRERARSVASGTRGRLAALAERLS